MNTRADTKALFLMQSITEDFNPPIPVTTKTRNLLTIIGMKERGEVSGPVAVKIRALEAKVLGGSDGN